MEDIIQYIISFLAGKYSSFITYGNESDKNNIIIIKYSKFYEQYGNKESMPDSPVTYLNSIPVLYGENRIEYRNGRAYVYADLIASSFFMISGYEELINQSRDDWNRFRGEYSFAGKNGFINRPIVDEYRLLLEEILRQTGVDVPVRKKEIEKIYLTHDVDQPWKYYTFKTMLRHMGSRLIRNHTLDIEPLKCWLGIYKDDSYLEALSYLKNEDIQLISQLGEKSNCIYFILANEQRQKYTNTYINKTHIKEIIRTFEASGFLMGIHASPLSNENIKELEKEKTKLQSLCSREIDSFRSHCLLPRKNSEDNLLKTGMKQDFSYGYPDMAGFRLGTSRKVRCINPVNKKLTGLYLQPLIIMDGTLDDPRYMNMNYDEALNCAQSIIEQIKRVNGELCILWHNHTCAKDSGLYHRKLYKQTLQYIAENHDS